MENQTGKSLFATALPYAGILSVVTIMITLVCYITGLSFFFGGIVANMLKGIGFLVTMIIVVIHWRKTMESVSYGQAFLFGLIIIGLYIFIVALFDFCFYRFIAPNFYQELWDSTLNFMIKFNVPQKDIDDADAKFAEGAAGATPFGLTAQMMVMRAIVDVVLLAIISIFARKERPVTPTY